MVRFRFQYWKQYYCLNYFIAVKIRLLSCLCTFILFTGICQAQNQSDVAILKALDKASDAQKDSLYYELVKIYRSNEQELAKYYAHLAYTYSTRNQHSAIQIKSCYAIGFLYNQTGRYDSAIYFYEQGVDLAQKSMPDRLVYFYNDLGNVYENMDVYDSALANYLRSYEIALELNLFQDQAIANNNIGTIYSRLGNFNESSIYYRRALEIKRQHDILDGLDVNMINLAFSLNSLGRYTESLDLLEEVIDFCKTHTCDKNKDPDVYYALGYGYLNQAMQIEAYEAFKRSTELAKALDNTRAYCSGLVMMGRCEIQNNNLQLAQAHLVEAQKLADQKRYKRTLKDAYEQLSVLYEKQGLLEKSLEMNKRFILIKDSLFNETLANNLKELQVEVTRKQGQRIIDEKEDEIARGRLISLLTGAVSLLTIGLSFSLFVNLRNNRNMKVKLQAEVASKTKSLQTSNDKLAQVNEKLHQSQLEYDSLIYRTSHDIRGPLATLLGLTTLAKKEFAKDPACLGDYLDKIHVTGDNLNNVLSGLLLVNSLRTQEIQNESVRIFDVVQASIKQCQSIPHFPLIDLVVDVENELQVTTDKVLLQVALEQLIQNAITYTTPTSASNQVRIYAKVSEDARWMLIKIEDNGIGIEPDMKDRIFELFFVATERHGAGIGLYLARTALERIGSAVLVTRLKKPTVFEIRVPIIQP